jgi:hypothetical protein
MGENPGTCVDRPENNCPKYGPVRKYLHKNYYIFEHIE